MRLSSIPLSAWVGILGIALALFCALFAPFNAPYGESEIVGSVWQPMGGDFLLGTDNLGRDLFSRLIFGARTTIFVALAATVLSFSIATADISRFPSRRHQSRHSAALPSRRPCPLPAIPVPFSAHRPDAIARPL